MILKPGVAFAEKEIRDHCKQHLHDWKCPKEILFLDELPRNKMGKVMKEEIVKYFRNLSSPPKEGS